jgi:hypothetical protein
MEKLKKNDKLCWTENPCVGGSIPSLSTLRVSDNFRYPFSFVRNSVRNLFSASRTAVIIVVCE